MNFHEAFKELIRTVCMYRFWLVEIHLEPWINDVKVIIYSISPNKAVHLPLFVSRKSQIQDHLNTEETCIKSQNCPVNLIYLNCERRQGYIYQFSQIFLINWFTNFFQKTAKSKDGIKIKVKYSAMQHRFLAQGLTGPELSREGE